MKLKHPILYTPEALNHIGQIAAWYNEQKPGLGKRFKNHLKTSLKQIQTNPFAHTVRYDNVRFAVVYKFPYAAHYTVNELGHIIVHVVLGFKENPDKWLSTD